MLRKPFIFNTSCIRLSYSGFHLIALRHGSIIFSLSDPKTKNSNLNILTLFVVTGDSEMTDDTLSHSELLTIIQNLDTDEQLRLMEEVATIIRNRVKTKKHSILELRGLGKEIWESVDAQEYVDRERDSWTG